MLELSFWSNCQWSIFLTGGWHSFRHQPSFCFRLLRPVDPCWNRTTTPRKLKLEARYSSFAKRKGFYVLEILPSIKESHKTYIQAAHSRIERRNALFSQANSVIIQFLKWKQLFYDFYYISPNILRFFHILTIKVCI